MTILAAPAGAAGAGPTPVQWPVQSPIQSPVQLPVGGGPHAAQGADALGPVLARLDAVVASLSTAIAGAFGGAAAKQCGCGPDLLPPPPPPAAAGATAAPGATAAVADPASVRDRTSTAGLGAASLRGLEEAHRFGLPLVSGKRGGDTTSDHFHGNAIDVGTLPIGAASSTEGTPQMKAFAEHMRLAGQRGELGVKYVILDGRIASARDNWAWRPYTYPGKSAAELASLRESNRGEYNRIQHYDHVHVSFG